MWWAWSLFPIWLCLSTIKWNEHRELFLRVWGIRKAALRHLTLTKTGEGMVCDFTISWPTLISKFCTQWDQILSRSWSVSYSLQHNSWCFPFIIYQFWVAVELLPAALDHSWIRFSLPCIRKVACIGAFPLYSSNTTRLDSTQGFFAFPLGIVPGTFLVPALVRFQASQADNKCDVNRLPATDWSESRHWKSANRTGLLSNFYSSTNRVFTHKLMHWKVCKYTRSLLI